MLRRKARYRSCQAKTGVMRDQGKTLEGIRIHSFLYEKVKDNHIVDLGADDRESIRVRKDFFVLSLNNNVVAVVPLSSLGAVAWLSRWILTDRFGPILPVPIRQRV